MKLKVKVVGPRDGVAGFLGSIGVRFMIDGQEAGQRLALVEHPMSPRALPAPLHKHTREDEYSFVLAGRLGALLGDEVVIGKPGDLIFKPRDQWHVFWNAGDEPARILEASRRPASKTSSANGLGGVTQAPPQLLADLCERYGLELQPDSVPDLIERFGLRLPGEPTY
jgi:quercetin dioxygenase-like cupin family protein